jgi:putative RecB family exonuclease
LSRVSTSLTERPGPAAVAEPVPAANPQVDLPIPVLGSLSPSRASDFMTCPLRYRFRVIDRLPEPASPAATRGTLVHAVLEQLFELPARERTPEAAAALLAPTWARAVEQEPELAALVADGEQGLEDWLRAARDLLTGYFSLEDPRRLQPAARELFVEHVLPSGLQLRGYIDRLDEAPTGEVRVVDYKTGRSPGPNYERSALFQMKFYALVWWHSRGVLARELRLYYLGDRQSLVYHPDEAELRSFERTVHALWRAIDRARTSGDWRASPSRLCDWCDHQALCPAFGGTPPPLPVVPEARVDEPPPTVCEASG